MIFRRAKKNLDRKPKPSTGARSRPYLLVYIKHEPTPPLQPVGYCILEGGYGNNLIELF